MLRRLLWVIVCCGIISALAAYVVIVKGRPHFENSETLVPRAARGSRVIGLTDTETNVITSKPLWGSDVLGKGGLDIVWGPIIPQSQWVILGWGGSSPSCRPQTNYYTYPLAVKMYVHHTYHWRRLDDGGVSLIRNADGTVRQYTASVDQLSMTAVNWAGPFPRNTPLRGQSSASLIPQAARGSQVRGLTDTVTVFHTIEPLWMKGGVIGATGPLLPMMVSATAGPVTASPSFPLAKNCYSYATLVTTYRRHTYHWRLAASAGEQNLSATASSARQQTAVVDEYAGSGLSWATPIPDIVPWPVQHGASS